MNPLDLYSYLLAAAMIETSPNPAKFLRKALNTSTLRPWIVRGLLLTVVCTGVSCHDRDRSVEIHRQPDRNVLLITIDTLRADHLGAYGSRAKTPNLDRLAAEGAVFERCVSQTPLTLPSHTTLLSGTYPPHHGVRDNGGMVVPDELELVSETLQGRGYATAAFVGAFVLHSKWGLDQGFDLYDDAFDRPDSQPLLLQNSRRAEEVVEPAREWITAHRERPFFTWIHIFDPHTPYDPPPPFDSDPTQLYQGEVEYTDFVLGGLIAFLEQQRLLENTLIVVTADHGEGLGEHGEKEHGFFLYDSTVRVPLIIRGPERFPVRRWGGLVELVDLAPTILGWLGIPSPGGVQGHSLLPILHGRTEDAGATAYAETFYPRFHYGWSELQTIYRGDLKLVSAPRPELYDLQRDPGELVDLALEPADDDDLSALRADLEDMLNRVSVGALSPSEATISPEDRASLEALGYVTTTADVGDSNPPADPKDKILIFNRIADAAALLDQKKYDEAIAIASDAVAADPRLVDAHILLGNAFRGAGRLDDAVGQYRQALGLKPDSNFAMIDLLSCLLHLGSDDEAIKQGLAFLEIFPDDAILHEQLAAAYASRRDNAAALQHLEFSITRRPSCGALTGAAEIFLLENQPRSATDRIRQALDLDPTCRGAWYLLGRIADSDGRVDEALSHFRREVANHEDAYLAAFNAAVILGGRGQRAEALRYCRIAITADPPFGLPYFMIAADHLARGTDFDEAVELCRTGIRAAPEDADTLIGYQTLLRLLEKTGDRQGFERATRESEALRRRLGSVGSTID